MISETVMPIRITENRNNVQEAFTKCGIYAVSDVVKPNLVLTTGELLGRLRDRGIKNADIARALKVSPSRVTEIFKGERSVSLDEGAILVEKFDLESPQDRRVAPLPAQVSRLLVRYVAAELGVDLERNLPLLQELTEDVRAFAEYVADPSVRENPAAAEAFFQAMRLRRPKPADKVPPGSDPERAR